MSWSWGVWFTLNYVFTLHDLYTITILALAYASGGPAGGWPRYAHILHMAT